MPLPWVRLDANVSSHDKVLSLLSDPSPKKWQAMSSYFFALGWAGGQGTDGFVPIAALPFVHGTQQTARLLVKHQMWDEGLTGWTIRNYADRQQTSRVTDAIKTAQSQGAKRANCERWHGKECGCWKVAK
jgi:hypothetical protein